MSAGFKVQFRNVETAPLVDLGGAAQEFWAHTADKAGLIARCNTEAGFEKFKLVPA